MRQVSTYAACGLIAIGASAPAYAAMDGDLVAMRTELMAQKVALDKQQKEIDAQRLRLQALEDSLLSRMRGTGADEQVAGDLGLAYASAIGGRAAGASETRFPAG